VSAVGEETREPLLRQRDRVRPRDADGVETQFAGLRGEFRLQRRRI
jgi:hypothetical protein